MREWPRLGERVVHSVTVTSDMTARLFGREVHPAYATAWMVRHVEEAGRLLVERYLRSGEDATGYRIDLTRELPAFVGERLTVTATATDVTDAHCLCEFVVTGPEGPIGRGEFEQRYIARGRLTAGAADRARTPGPST
jgi:fluoroacetyl-CoA thioesterase